MGVGVQSEACGEVVQHSADGFDIHAVLKGEGCEGVTEVMEPNLGDARSFQHTLQHIVHTVRRDGAAVWGWEYILVIGFRFLGFQNFYRLR